MDSKGKLLILLLMFIGYACLCILQVWAYMLLYVDNFYRKIYKKKEAINLVLLVIDGSDEHRGMKTLI
jgi:uncharacterized membrane protein